MGRPTKYTPELLEKAQHYLDNYENYDDAFPSDIGLCDALDISTSTLYEWAKDDNKQKFLDILDKINTRQQRVAWRKGLDGTYNASLIKLLLGKHGYSDKADNTNTNHHSGEVTVNISRVVHNADNQSE